jgi:hypothetical protein
MVEIQGEKKITRREKAAAEGITKVKRNIENKIYSLSVMPTT